MILQVQTPQILVIFLSLCSADNSDLMQAVRTITANFYAQSNDRHAKIMIDLEDAYQGTTRSISLKIPQTDQQGHLINKTHTLNVKIPKGVKAGQRIRPCWTR